VQVNNKTVTAHQLEKAEMFIGNLETFYFYYMWLFVPLIGIWVYWLARGDSIHTRKWVVVATGYQVFLAIVATIGLASAVSIFISPVIMIVAEIPSLCL